MVLKKGDRPSSLAWVGFWVHVLDVSFEWHLEEIGCLLGQELGLVVEVDISGPFLRL